MGRHRSDTARPRHHDSKEFVMQRQSTVLVAEIGVRGGGR